MTRSPALLALAAVLAVGLAGCSDGGGGGEHDGAHGTMTGHSGHSPAQIPLPTWQVGQWWTLASEQAEGTITHVVSGETATDWTIDTDAPDTAFFDARFDISMVGPVRKSDLAGAQGDQRVEFFRFPLTHHETWTTSWDGVPITINVTSLAVGKAGLEARHANGTLYARYTYDEAIGYFRDFTFYAADGEEVAYAARVTGSGTGFDGDLVRWTLTDLFQDHGPMGARETTFIVGPGLTDVWVDLHLTCAQGGFSITLGPATGPAEERGLTVSGPCPAQLDETSTVIPPVQDEYWGVFIAAAPPENGFLDLTILGRTQTLFKAGAAP